MANLFKTTKFVFIGEMGYGKEPVTTKKLSDTSKWSRTKANISVKDDKNMQFINLEYIHSDDVKTTKIYGVDGEMFEVNLNDTANKGVVERAADFIRTTVDLESDFEKKAEYMKAIFRRRNHEMKKAEEKTEEDTQKIAEYTAEIKEKATNRVEFCHVKDVIALLSSAKDVLAGKKVKITGSVKNNFYNGKNQLQYIPSTIELVPEDTENQLKVYADVFFDKDGIDDDKAAKKVFVNGYLGEKIKKVEKLFPTTFVIDYTKIDESNPVHVQLLEYMKGIFKITDKKQVHKMGVEINVINGNETVEFDETQLTDQQKLAIAVGMNKLEDFRPRGNIYGNRISELRVANGDFKTYTEGAVECGISVKELEEYIFVEEGRDVKVEDVKVNSEEPKQGNNTSDLLKGLFG